MSAPLRLVRRAAALLALLVAAAPGAAGGQAVPRDSILALVNPVHFGIPTSPAFALLPEQPGEVPHVVTPSDFQAVLKSWFDGNRLKVGAAFDSRPFVRSAGDLRSYARSPLRAALFRTVVSAGTAAARKGSDDVLMAVGVRFPLIDRGDPRADSAYQERLAAAYTAALVSLGPPPFDAGPEVFAERRRQASAALDSIRRRYAAEHWNALKLDVGLAGSVRTAGDEPRADSLQGRQGGIWSALSLPLERFGQLTFSGRAVWSRADTATDPTGSYTAGARARLFASDRFAFSAEAASVWGRYDDGGLDERWTHLGVAAEWYVPELKGWIGAGYGGDTGRRGEPDARFALRYAFYRDRVLKP
ncbi:MAG TPA: hypothetical protein VF263_12875 [Longimicrobiaceae bacterium]